MSSSKIPIRKVLLIDDDADELQIFEEAIKEIDSSISVLYNNGCYKLDVQVKEIPDLIFLDINMPGCDGFECLKKLRLSELKDVPVIMYTTTSNVDSIIKAYSMGANLFMIKSFSYSKLVIYLTTLFEYKWNEPGINSKYYFREGNLVPI
jgi:DNA-binding NtrC family response regulator